jgi:hypothetical protein
MSRATTSILAVATLVAATIWGGTAVLASGERMTVHVDEAFVVDGQAYPAGPVTVRMLRAYNPSSNLNEIWAGDQRLGMLVTRQGEKSDTIADDSLLFARDADGTLVMVGYTLRGDDRAQLLKPSRKNENRQPTLMADGSTRAQMVVMVSQ